ncbi:hypothetical protein TNCV_3573331 [Trichonephila clavipes]|nr:hypothetical protein TNCV_3573331 [Trichonephila clavipes]
MADKKAWVKVLQFASSPPIRLHKHLLLVSVASDDDHTSFRWYFVAPSCNGRPSSSSVLLNTIRPYPNHQVSME